MSEVSGAHSEFHDALQYIASVSEWADMGGRQVIASGLHQSVLTLDRLIEQSEAQEKQLIEIAEKGYERVLQSEYERVLQLLDQIWSEADNAIHTEGDQWPDSAIVFAERMAKLGAWRIAASPPASGAGASQGATDQIRPGESSPASGPRA